MASPVPRSCSFVLRVWVKGADDEGTGRWSGEVIHAPTGERSAVHSLREVLGFIAPRLRAMGASPHGLDRLLEQLSHAPTEAPP